MPGRVTRRRLTLDPTVARRDSRTVSTMEIVALVLVPIVALALGLGIAYALPRREPPLREDLIAAARAEHDERLRAARSKALETRAEAEAIARQTPTSL